MTEIIARPTKYVRWLFEFLLSMNIAWWYIWGERMREIPFYYRGLGRFVSPYITRIYRSTGIGEGETVVEQVAWSFLFAVFIFLLLRLLAYFPPTKTLLCTLGGAFALAGFPLLVLRFPGRFFNPLLRVEAHWLFLEVVVVLVCALLYYFRRWPVPALWSILLLALHFGLWNWVIGNYLTPLSLIRTYGFWSLAFWISTTFYFGFPVIGFLSSLTWGRYVRLIAGTHPAAKAAAAP